MKLHLSFTTNLLAILCLCLGIGLFAAPAKAELPRTGQISCYDADGNVVDHASTSQDGDIQAGAVWPSPRFTNNGDGTITDRLTGLMWLMNGDCLGIMTWEGAVEYVSSLNADKANNICDDLTVAYKDWTLPEIWQLESLYNGQEKILAAWLNKQGFRSLLADGYWSSTTGPNPYSAWFFEFGAGVVKQKIKVDYLSVLLVRKAEAGAVKVLNSATGSASGRFIDNGDGTVSDTETGLMWLQDGSCLGEGQWQEAINAVNGLNADPASSNCQSLSAKYSDWSLPNRLELRSLVDHQVDLPAISPDSPLVQVQPEYWSATSVTSQPDSAYDLRIATGELHFSSKGNVQGIWAVRPVDGRPERARALLEPPDSPEFSLLRPIGARKNISWPSSRFTVHDDGTVTDNITGLMWLKDAACFTPERWDKSREVLGWLNTVPEKLARKCADYTAKYNDWQLPDLAAMQSLAEAADKEIEPAEWLKSQGVHGLVARDYWTLTENPMNLYHAWAVNLMQGASRNYPKSFPLNFWPVRRPQGYKLAANPDLFIQGNGESKILVLEQGKEMKLVVGIKRVKGVMPADFWIWYKAPEGTERWLTENGEWKQDKVPVYHGNIFNITDYTVFHADTVGLKKGKYTFHFSVEPAQQDDIYPVLFSSDFELEIIEEGVSR